MMRIVQILVLLVGSLLMIGSTVSAQQPVECETGFRLVEHELLAEPICVPENPQRVVSVHLTAFELLVMLNKPPVARPDDAFLTALYGGAPAVLDHVLEVVGDAPAYGAFDPNLEVLAEAKPDLILVYQGAANLDALRAIAPVIESPVQSYQPANWSELSEFYAEVLGVTDEYEALMAGYESRMATFNEMKDESFDGMSLVYAQVDGAGSIYVGLPGLVLWETITDAGFVPVDTLPTTPEAALEAYGMLITQVSDEQVNLLDADIIIVVNGTVNREQQDTVTTIIESYQSNPVWGTLHAVQNDRLYPKSVYWQSNGFISVHAVIDDLFSDFAGVNASEVSPNPFLPLSAEATPESSG